MCAFDKKTEDTGFVCRSSNDPETVNRGQGFRCIVKQRSFMCCNSVDTHGIHKVQGSTESDDAFYVRGTRFKFMRDSSVGAFFHGHCGNHFTATLIRRKYLQTFAFPVEYT